MAERRIPWKLPRLAVLIVLTTGPACSSTGSSSSSSAGSSSSSTACVRACLSEGRGCRACVATMAQHSYVVPRTLRLRYGKAHPGIPAPEVSIEHHHFRERPPHGQRRGKTHADCPAMRARSGLGAVTLRMPYTARFHRNGSLEFECDWVRGRGSPHTQLWDVPHGGVDSPWFRLPQSHLHVFTVGDTRAGVWIINSGVYIDDTQWQASLGAAPADKGGSSGIKWLLQPLPHRKGFEQAGHPWQIEQGVREALQHNCLSKYLNYCFLPADGWARL
jgi:hypothetical protein